MVGFEDLAPNQKLFLKLCMKLQIITKLQIDKFLLENSDVKEMSLALLQNNLISMDGLKKAVDLMNISSLCPHCNNINIYQEREGDEDICRHCQKPYSYHLSTSAANSIAIKYGNYKIIEEIGSGSMGIVYKAQHITLDRYAALKILKMDNQDSTGLARFHSEARAIAVLNHPNIVAIYDTGEEKGQHYIAMEYVDGKCLIDLMKEKISIKKKVEIVIQIAYALQHAHDNKIIHRDIKPENIMLSKDSQVKLTDFGLARSLKQSCNITQENLVIGTPLYMSPEQIHGLELTPATDIYSLGILLYELLIGKTPYFDKDPQAVLYKILSEQPLSPNFANKDIPYSLSQICMKAIEKNKQLRYPSAKDMAIALEKCLKGFGEILENQKFDLGYSGHSELGSQVISSQKILETPKNPTKAVSSSSPAKKIEEPVIQKAPARKIEEPVIQKAPARKIEETLENLESYQDNAEKKIQPKAKKVKKLEERDFLEENRYDTVALPLPKKEEEKKESGWSLCDFFSWILLSVFLLVLFYKIIHLILLQIKTYKIF